MPASSLLLPLLLYFALIAFNLVYFWRRRQQSIGVFASYITFFSGIYLLQPIMNVLPWYQPVYDPAIIYSGLMQVTIALLSLTAGIHLVAPLLRTFHRNSRRVSLPPQTISAESTQNHNLIYIYIGFSLISYFVLTPILGRILTVQTFLTGTSKLLHIGLILGFWAYIQNPRSRLLLLLCVFLMLLWPLVTITTTGFLGIGIAPTIFVLVFIVMRHKASRRLLVLAPVVIFLLLSFISTYFNNRNMLRTLVWGGSATSDVLDYTYRAYAENFSWFNVYEPKNLTWIDVRLNLTYFTGLAISNIDSGITTYANGDTVNDALLILVPRILWPDKPVVVGGNELLSYYTNLRFSTNTTWALGQVMELYINYGVLGVILGFMAFGVVLVTIDRRGAAALAAGNYYRFALWVMPFFGLLLVEDNFNHMFPTALSGLLAIYVVNLALKTQTAMKTRSIQPLPVRKETSSL